MDTFLGTKKFSSSSVRKGFWIKIPFIQQLLTSKEFALVCFFCCLFFILGVRLFWLQVVKYDQYDAQLSRLHYKESLLEPERGDIYALDKGWHPVKLTENLTLYDLALDPKDLTVFPAEKDQNGNITIPEKPMKPRFIELIAPIIYKHLCEINGMKVPTKAECVKNVELFSNETLLPKKPDLFYFWQGARSPEYETFDFTGYQENFNSVVEHFTKQKAMELIKARLDQKIQIWIKTSNYLGYFVEPRFLDEVKQLDLPYLSVENENYLYIIPARIENKTKAISQMRSLLKKRRYPIGVNFETLFEVQEWRYIKLISGLNPELAQEIRELKSEHQFEKSKINKETNTIGIPVLYGLILEPFMTRYYPYGEFMANTLGYVDKKGVAYYGIEQYFDNILKGKKGEVRGRSSGIAGNIWTNEFEILQPIDGSDVYLTLDIGLQREAEEIARKELAGLRADAISILVLDTENGQVKASVNAPTFNPNSYNDAYTLVPLWEEYAHLIDNLSYVDIPVYVYTGNDYHLATRLERQNTGLQKFINKNVFGPQVFVDKNISSPFEPGSIFKAFTIAIGLDTDEMAYQDRYQDEGSVKVWTYTIKNASRACEGNHNFLHAFIHSCNVGMAKIVQRIQKYAFYNYLTRLGFGSLTEIELAWEKEGFLDNVNTVSLARFLNNAFGQGLTTTQIQLAAAYAALVNGGYYVKPTIIAGIFNKDWAENATSMMPQEKKKIFSSSTSEELRKGLWEVLNNNPEISNSANIPQVKLGAKSWTAQISYRWRYQRWEGRTNGTFAGIISVDQPKYAVLIWVRRPRRNQWWWFTAGPIFKQIASYILTYDM